MQKAVDLLRLCHALQASRTGLTLEDIQARFEVSRRTAERMRDAVGAVMPGLQVANPGESSRRWRLRTTLSGALLNITPEELAALATAAELARRESLQDIAGALDAIADKLRAAMPDEVACRVETDFEALTEAEGLAMRPGPRPRIDTRIVNDLRLAMLSCRKVRIHYWLQGEKKWTRRTLEPYGFVYGVRHFLLARQPRANSDPFRLFRLPNIRTVKLLDDSFTRVPAFSLPDFLAQSFGVFQESPVDAAWTFSPAVADDVREFIFHPSQTMQEHTDGRITVRFRAGGLQHMCWHLFTWGDAVLDIEPPELKEMYGTMLRQASPHARG